MKKRLLKISLIILPILFAISIFEIANMGEYYSDQSWGETTIQESNHTPKMKAMELKQLHEEMKYTENGEDLMKFLSAAFFLAFFLVMYFYDKEKTASIRISKS